MKYLVMFIFLSGCGIDQGNDGVQDGNGNYALALKTLDEMPPCNEDNVNQLIYVKDSLKFYTCDGEWHLIPNVGLDYSQSLSPNLWVNPASGKKYFIAGRASKHFVCNNVDVVRFRPADKEEIERALYQGLDIFLNELKTDIKYIYIVPPENTPVPEWDYYQVSANGEWKIVKHSVLYEDGYIARTLCIEN